VRQTKRIVERFREEGIDGLKKKSTRPMNQPIRIPEEVEKVIVEARKKRNWGRQEISNCQPSTKD